MRGELPWEALERHDTTEAVVAAKRATDARALSRGLPEAVSLALIAVWEHAEMAQQDDTELDHRLCIEALRRALSEVQLEAREDDAAHGDSRADYDWGGVGLSWTEGGDIVDSDGTVLHAVGTD